MYIYIYTHIGIGIYMSIYICLYFICIPWQPPRRNSHRGLTRRRGRSGARRWAWRSWSPGRRNAPSPRRQCLPAPCRGRRSPGTRRGSSRSPSCRWSAWSAASGGGLAFTRYSFTSRLLCTNLTSLDPIRPSALATLLQYYCTTIGQYSTPSRPTLLYAIHHARLIRTISCKGQAAARNARAAASSAKAGGVVWPASMYQRTFKEVKKVPLKVPCNYY